MIDEGTTITRLLDKLEAAGLIARERSEPDRRQVMCYVTDAGRRLLNQLDPKVDALDEAAVGFLRAGQARGAGADAGRDPAGQCGPRRAARRRSPAAIASQRAHVSAAYHSCYGKCC